jgi:hypothetical protein
LNIQAQDLSGLVTDEKGEPIPNALITLLHSKDSTIINYTTTNLDGKFSIRMSNNETLFKVSSFGFVPFLKEITSSNNNFLIILKENPILLSEVVVKGYYSGIRQKNDTITYDAKIFKDGSELNLGDLLNKMPGIDVDDKGNVSSQGKKVSNLLINGIDHFSGNVQLAAKNVSADIAEKVEVLNNYGEYSLLDGFKTNDKTAINIGVSKDKLGKITGDLTVGGGVKDNFSTRANLMQILPKFMISYIGAINNNGDQLFSIDDFFQLKGGINEVMGKEGRFNISEEEKRLLYPSDNTYKRINGLAAVNFSFQSSKSLKINSYLLYYDNHSKAEVLKNYTFQLSNSTSKELTEQSKSKTKNNLASGFIKMTYNIDTTLTLTYNGDFSKSKLLEDFSFLSQKEIEVNSYDNSKITPIKTMHELMLLKSFGKKVLVLGGKLQYERTPSILDIVTDSLLLPITHFYQDGLTTLSQKKRQIDFSGEVYSSFLLPLNKSYYMKYELGFEKKSSKLNNSIDNGHTINIDSLYNNISFDIQKIYNNIELVKNKGYIQFKLSLISNIYNYSTNKDLMIDRATFYRFSPKMDVTLKFNAKSKLNVNLSSDYLENPINNFNNHVIIDSYKSYKSSSKSKTLFNHKYTIRGLFSYFDHFNSFSLVSTIVYQKVKNINTLNNEQDDIVTQSMYMLSKPKDVASFTISLDKGLGFIPWNLSLVGVGSHSSFSNLISLKENNMKNSSFKTDVLLTSKYEFPLNIELSYKINMNSYKFDFSEKLKQNSQDFGGKLKVKVSSKFYGEVQYIYVRNKVSEDKYNTHILASLLRYNLSKKVSIQLQANNLLHLNNFNWQTTSFINNYQIDRKYRRIPGYAIISTNIRF